MAGSAGVGVNNASAVVAWRRLAAAGFGGENASRHREMAL